MRSLNTRYAVCCAVGYESFRLLYRGPGTMYCWGQTIYGQSYPPVLSSFVSGDYTSALTRCRMVAADSCCGVVSASIQHTCGLTSGGQIYVRCVLAVSAQTCSLCWSCSVLARTRTVDATLLLQQISCKFPRAMSSHADYRARDMLFAGLLIDSCWNGS